MNNKITFRLFLILIDEYRQELFCSYTEKDTIEDIEKYFCDKNGYEKVHVIELDTNLIALRERNNLSCIQDPYKYKSKERYDNFMKPMNEDIVSLDIAVELDWMFDGAFENSHYVWDTTRNSKNSSIDSPYLRNREIDDEDSTYVAPNKYDLIMFAIHWSQISDKAMIQLFYFMNVNDIAKQLIDLKLKLKKWK